MTIEKKEKIVGHLFGISILIAFLVPHTNMTLMMLNPILCIILNMSIKKKVVMSTNFIVLIPLLITFIFNSLQNVDMKTISRTLILLLFFATFPFVGAVKVKPAYLYSCLAIIFTSQVAYMLGIGFMQRIMEAYYPIEWNVAGITNMENSVTADNVLDFRLGGLYRNPNHLAKYVELLYAYFLVTVPFEKKNVFHIAFVIISFMAVIMSGSRTAFLIFVLLSLALYVSKGKIKLNSNTIIMAVAVVVFGYVLNTTLSEARGLMIDEGMQDSVHEKTKALMYYLTTEDSAIRFLIGWLDPQRFVSIGTLGFFDSDIGNLIFVYGFIGFFCILYYFWRLAMNMDSHARLFFILLLWMVSSSIISAYRTIFVFMLLLSNIYSCYPNKSQIRKVIHE